MNFWLTDQDKGLVGVHSSRDPLGMLPIWSNRGRRIVRHLTEQSNNARGFQVLVACLALYEEYTRSRQDYVAPEQFFLLAEQAFAGCTFKELREWKVPGGLRVSARALEKTTLGLDRQYWTMGDQLGNGIWGIYRSAATRSGILDDRSTQLSYEFLRDMSPGPTQLLSARARGRLFSVIDSAVAAPDKGIELGGGTLQRELAGIYRELPNRDTIREYLYRPGDIEHRIVTWLADEWPDVAELDYRSFFEACRKKFSDMHDDFLHIIRCENLIAPLDRVFRHLFNFVGKPIAEAGKSVAPIVSKMRTFHAEFGDSGIYTAGTHHLYRIYLDTLDTDNAEGFVASLLECHRKVAVARGREPWLYEESGQIQSSAEGDAGDELDIEPGEYWLNDYYIRPLYNVYQALVKP